MTKEIRQLLFDYFDTDYSSEDIDKMLTGSDIVVLGNIIKLTYDNGNVEIVEIRQKPYLAQIHYFTHQEPELQK